MLVVSYYGTLSEDLVVMKNWSIAQQNSFKVILSEDLISKFVTNIFFLKTWSVNFFQTYSF